MLPITINPLPLIFTIAATFGVLVHDTQVDRATTVALAMPAAFATFAAVDSVIKSSEQHVHVERVAMPHHLASLGNSLPRIQPRDDDRRYVQSKKIAFGSMDSGYIWPSV
jgi:hypothetical protein